MPVGRDLAVSEAVWAEEQLRATLSQSKKSGLQETYLAAAVWGTLYLISGLLIFEKGKSEIAKACRRQWPLFALTCFVPLSLLWASYSSPVAMNSLHAVGGLLVAFAASMFYRQFPEKLGPEIALALGAAVCAHLAAVALLPAISVFHDGRWRGLAANPNTLGAIASLTFFFCYASLPATHHRKLIVAFLLLSSVAVIGSGSVTATLALISALLTHTILKAGQGTGRNLRFYILIGAPYGAVIGYMMFSPILDLTLAVSGKSADFSGRILHWVDALNLVQERPIFGWSFDNHAKAIEVSRLATGHFHNGFLDLMVRGGVFAVALFVAFFWRLLWDLRTVGRAMTACIIGFMVYFVVHNMAEVSTLKPRNGLWIILATFALTASNTISGRNLAATRSS